MNDTQQTAPSHRSAFFGAVIVVLGAVLVIGVLWLAARGAPSSARDPQMTPLALVPTRVATRPPASEVDAEE
ncbi:MAG: hypothetical protein U0031_14460 [Thermomicrobiales bacterium]